MWMPARTGPFFPGFSRLFAGAEPSQQPEGAFALHSAAYGHRAIRPRLCLPGNSADRVPPQNYWHHL